MVFIDAHPLRLRQLGHTISANSVDPATHLAYRLSLDSMDIDTLLVCGVKPFLHIVIREEPT